jgi:ribosomal protein L13
MKNYTIDAQGKRIGRVASEAANILMGKNSVKYARNIAPEVKVSIINTQAKATSAQRRSSTRST